MVFRKEECRSIIMVATVKLGPLPLSPKGQSPMMKEIFARQNHLDLVFRCDDGNCYVHKMVVAAHSQFMKKLLLDAGDEELAEIILPGIKREHVRLVIRIIYTGSMKITKHNLQTTYTLWYVRQILTEILKIDSNINLGPYILNKPPEYDDPPGGGGGGAGSPPPAGASHPPPSGTDDTAGGGAGRHGPSAADGDSSAARFGFAADPNPRSNSGGGEAFPVAAADPLVAATEVVDVHNVAQKAVIPVNMETDNLPVDVSAPVPVATVERTEEVMEISTATTAPTTVDEAAAEEGNGAVGVDSDIEEVDVPRLPTPELIHLLDSDSEEEARAGQGGSSSGGRYTQVDLVEGADIYEGSNNGQEDDSSIEEEEVDDNMEEEGDDVVGREDWQGVLEDRIQIPQAPRLLRKNLSADDDLPGTEALGNGVRMKRKKKKKRRELDRLITVKREKSDDTGKEISGGRKRGPGRPRKYSSPTPSTPPEPLLPKADFLEPNQVVYRGKIIDARKRRKKTPVPKAPHAHVHISATITGLKKAETLAVIKEENALHTCDQCERVYLKYRSLKIHKQRMHNSRLDTACPECGKLLAGKHTLKKHLLSHRPEEMWPYECPICHKKFQARGDIPKHLMAKLHENDNIPQMGTKEWYHLIYYDRPVDYESLKIKLEQRHEKERSKLMDPAAREEYDTWDGTARMAAEQAGNGGQLAETAPDPLAYATYGLFDSVPAAEGWNGHTEPEQAEDLNSHDPGQASSSFNGHDPRQTGAVVALAVTHDGLPPGVSRVSCR